MVLFPKRKLIYMVTASYVQEQIQLGTKTQKNEKTTKINKSFCFSQHDSVHRVSTSQGMQLPICTNTKWVSLHPFFSIMHIIDHFTPTIIDELLPHLNGYCFNVRLKKYLTMRIRTLLSSNGSYIIGVSFSKRRPNV